MKLRIHPISRSGYRRTSLKLAPRTAIELWRRVRRGFRTWKPVKRFGFDPILSVTTHTSTERPEERSLKTSEQAGQALRIPDSALANWESEGGRAC
jgi:hypothetical protein